MTMSAKVTRRELNHTTWKVEKTQDDEQKSLVCIVQKTKANAQAVLRARAVLLSLYGWSKYVAYRNAHIERTALLSNGEYWQPGEATRYIVELINRKHKVDFMGKKFKDLVQRLPGRIADIMYRHFVIGVSQGTIATDLGLSRRTINREVAIGVERFAGLLEAIGIFEPEFTKMLEDNEHLANHWERVIDQDEAV